MKDIIETGAGPLALEEDPSPKKGKKPEAPPLTLEDLEVINESLKGSVDKEAKAKVRNVLDRDGLRTILRSQQEHLQSVESALLIADRWDPRNENKERKTTKDGDRIRILSFAAGNLNSSDELEADAVYLSALNAKISNLWAISKAAVNRAKANLSIAKAEANKAVSEARRTGHLRGKVKNLDHIESITKVFQSVRDAEQDLLDVEEQAELLSGCYYSVKDLSQTLMDRAKGRRREQWEAKQQPN